MKNLTYMLLISIFLASFLTGCGAPLAPFDATVVSMQKDDTAPVIQVISPLSDSLFSQSVTVTGRISDDGTEMPVMSYTVADSLGSSSKTGELEIIPIEADAGVAGTFHFEFTTTEFSTDILLTINGSDWNDNDCQPVTLRLAYPGSSISSFKAVPGNKTAALSWDAVEGADDYNLYYTTDGSFPSEQYGLVLDGLLSSYSDTAPLVFDDLENGNVYTFLLVASAGNTEWRSGYEQVVPLSPLSLKPSVISLYGGLQLSWQAMSSGLGYQVYRAVGNSDNYVNISGGIITSSFTDSNVNAETAYSYKILPSVDGSIFSESSSGSPAVFPYASSHLASTKITAAANSDVHIAGTSAYLSLGASGFQRVNVSNKINPNAYTAESWTGCNVKSVDVFVDGFNTYVYTADSSRGMQIYAYIKGDEGVKGLCPTSHSSGRINDVVYSDAGSYVYAGWPLDFTTDSGGIDKILVSNINSPTIVDTYTRFYADYHKVEVSSDGGYLFGVYIDPFTPYFGMDVIRTFDMSRVYPVSGDGIPALDVALAGDYAYVIDGTWLTIYDVTAPFSPVEMGQCVVPGAAQEINVEGDFAYVTEQDSGLRTINISDPENPVLIDLFSKESISGTDVSEGYAYLSGYDSKFSILNVSEFFELNQTVLYPVSEEPSVLKKSGDFIFIGTYDGNTTTDDPLKVVDLSEPSNPEDLCSFTALGQIRGIQVSNDYIYMTVSEFGGIKALQVVDFSDPSDSWNPQTFTYEMSDDVGGLAVKGDYAYIASNSAGFTVVDISDPDKPGWPAYASTTGTSGKISDCIVDGNSLYLLTSFFGLQIYDITDPRNPEFKGLYATEGSASELDVQNGWVYIADREGGLKMIDVSNPAASGWEPDVYHYLPEGDGVYVTNVSVFGDYAFITYYDGVSPYDDLEPGIDVVSISNPASPQLVGHSDVQGEYGNDIVVDADNIYIAVDENGLEVINLSYKE